MPRLETLKRRSDFQRLRKGASWSTPSFVLQASASSPHSRAPAPRFGFTVSDRAVRENTGGASRRAGAVTRNRARRRLKEAVRLVADEWARHGFDYVVIGRRAALNTNFAVLVENMKEAFANVHRPRRRRADKRN
jgi:ribonuclease P protein component